MRKSCFTRRPHQFSPFSLPQLDDLNLIDFLPLEVVFFDSSFENLLVSVGDLQMERTNTAKMIKKDLGKRSKREKGPEEMIKAVTKEPLFPSPVSFSSLNLTAWDVNLPGQ